MGSWGYKLFEDDVALDARSIFEDALEKNKDVMRATKEVLHTFKQALDDQDEGPTIFFALAALQMEQGILEFWLKDKVLEIIEKGDGLDVWREAGEKEVAKRMKELEKLKEKILSDKYPKKRKSKNRLVLPEGWQEGDWIAVPLLTGGYGILMLARAGQGFSSYGYLFAKKFNDLPKLEEVEKFFPRDAVEKCVFGRHANLSKTWKTIGNSLSFNREKWPMIPEKVTEGLPGGYRWRLDILSDENPSIAKERRIISDKEAERYPWNSTWSHATVEHHLTALLDPEGYREVEEKLNKK